MKQETVITGIEQLKQWFDKNQRPYYTIWRGYEAKNDRVLYRNEEISDMEASWEILQEMIALHSEAGGNFRVYVTDKPGHNWGMTTFLRVQPTNPEYATMPQYPAGIRGMGNPIFGYGNPLDMIEKEIAKAKKEWELERKVEELQQAQQSHVGALDRFVENIIERPEVYQLIQALGMKLLSGTSTKPSAPVESVGEQVSEHTDGFDYDRVESALDDIRQVFPDVESALEALAQFTKQNPDTARGLLGSIQQK